MAKPVVAVFCMPEAGHFSQVAPLIVDLARAGFGVRVFTDRRFAPEVEQDGGTFVDLFAAGPIESADSRSRPIPCRYVSYAALHAEEIAQDLRRSGVALVVYETFAVIGMLAAQILGVPFVNVSVGHNVDPAVFLPMLRADPRVAIADECHRAVEVLRSRYGWRDASPFSYVSGLSPYLNVYCEPPEFLTDAERAVFEPVAFYGCLPADGFSRRGVPGPGRYFGRPKSETGIYVSLGTTAPRYYGERIGAIYRAISDAAADLPQMRVLISLGGAAPEEGFVSRLTKPNVEVVGFADQWEALAASDLFLTHHGLNSTHEAIFHRVPMVSSPIFWDQPALAERCRQFGIAAPLAETVGADVNASQVASAIVAACDARPAMLANIDRARAWELETIAGRSAVIDRIGALAG